MGTLRNSVHLIGRPGMDPEIKKFGENRKLAKFTLATNEKHYNDNMELVQETEWHNIIAWGRTAEIVEKIVRKGRLMALEGKLQTRVNSTLAISRVECSTRKDCSRQCNDRD